MGLQVWLPLRGDLTQQGLSEYEISSNTATVSNDGKIGKCYNFAATTGWGMYFADDGFMDKYINNHSWTIGAWVKSTETDTAVMSLSYGLRLFAGSNASISLYNSSRTVNCASGKSTTDGNWHHLMCTYDVDTNIISFYFDGGLAKTTNYTSGYTYSSSWRNGIYIGRDPDSSATAHYFFKGSMNDVRIYDHCLTPKEVKEIAKGLILHYPLNDIPIGNNFLNLPSSFYFSGSDFASNSTRAKSSIFNGGSVTTATTSGNINAYNWANDYMPGIDITAAGTYTFSVDVRTIGYTGVSNTASIGIDFRKPDHSSLTSAYVIIPNDAEGSWTRVHCTLNVPAVEGRTRCLLSFGYYNCTKSGIVFEYKNFKLEKGIVDTPIYTKPGETSYTIYDCSGYNNDGTIVGNIKWSNDTPRYSGSYKLSDSASCIQAVNLATLIHDGAFTMNVWFKKTTGEWSTKGWETIFGGPSGFELSAKSGGTNSPNLWAYSWGNKSVTTYTLDEWHMLTMVRTTSDAKFYLDGELKYTGTAGSIPSGDYFFGAWSNSGAQNFMGHLSDARIYATALSADDIKELYETSALVSNNGTMMCYKINEYNTNLFRSELLKLYLVPGRNSADIVDRNGQAAIDIRPQPFYVPESGGISAHSAHILENEFVPNTRYVFDMYFDSDDSYYDAQSKNVPGGIIIYYTDGTSDASLYNTLGNKNNPIGWQHKTVITPANKSVSFIYIGYCVNQPVYYRLDSSITKYSESNINKNGVFSCGNVKEENDMMLQQGGSIISRNVIEF